MRLIQQARQVPEAAAALQSQTDLMLPQQPQLPPHLQAAALPLCCTVVELPRQAKRGLPRLAPKVTAATAPALPPQCPILQLLAAEMVSAGRAVMAAAALTVLAAWSGGSAAWGTSHAHSPAI